MGADLKPGSLFWLASKEASHFFAKPHFAESGARRRGGPIDLTAFRPWAAPT